MLELDWESSLAEDSRSDPNIDRYNYIGDYRAVFLEWVSINCIVFHFTRINKRDAERSMSTIK